MNVIGSCTNKNSFYVLHLKILKHANFNPSLYHSYMDLSIENKNISYEKVEKVMGQLS